MATVFPAITALKSLEVVGFGPSQPVPTLHVPEGAAQTFTAGDVLILSSGQAVIATAGVAATLLLGVAQQDATGTQGSEIAFSPFLLHTLIDAVLDDDGTTGHVAVAGDLFNPLGLGLDTGVFFLDENNDYGDDPTDAFAMPIGFVHQYDSNNAWKKCAIGDTRARVRAIVINSAFVNVVA